MRVSHAAIREGTPVSKFPEFAVTKTNPPKQRQIFTCPHLHFNNEHMYLGEEK